MHNVLVGAVRGGGGGGRQGVHVVHLQRQGTPGREQKSQRADAVRAAPEIVDPHLPMCR